LKEVDITRWNAKVNKLLEEYGPVVEKIVAYGNTKVAGAVIRNLSGPGVPYEIRTSKKTGKEYVKVSSMAGYYSSKLPVRRITGTLARAYQVKKSTPYLFMHLMNSGVAKYAKFVHEGTRFMKPRPYFKDAFDSNRQAILNYWNYQFILAMRKTGRA